MASKGAVMAAETLSPAEEAFLAGMASGDVPDVEATDAGRRNWAAFHAIRDAKGTKGAMSISAVASLSGCSRTPLATKGGRFRLLREAIRRECAPDPADVEAASLQAEAGKTKSAEERKQESVAYWRKRAQQSDSLNAAYLAQALAALREAENQKKRAKGFLDELQREDDGDE